MTLPQSATDAIKWLDRCNCSGRWGNAERFASSVDAVIVGAHRATSAKEVKLLATALYIAAVEETSSPSHRVVVTPAGRNALVAMSKYATTVDSVESLAKTLLYFITTPQSVEMLMTPLVRDALVALAKCASTPISVGYVSRAIRELLTNAARLNVIAVVATTSVRDALVTMATFATTATTVQCVSSAMTEMMRTLSSGEGANNILLVSQPVIDAMVTMSQFASSPGAVQYLNTAFMEAVTIVLSRSYTVDAASRKSMHARVANTRACDAIISLAKFATTPDAVICVTTTIYGVSTSFEKGSSFFVNEAFRDAFVTMAPYAILSADATRALCGAMLEVVKRNHCGDMFAVKEVMRVCGSLRRHASDSLSRQFAERLLSQLTECLTRKLMIRSLHGGGDQKSDDHDDATMITDMEAVLAGAEGAQRDDLVARMTSAIGYVTREKTNVALHERHQPVQAGVAVQKIRHDGDVVSPQALAAFAIGVMYRVSSSSTLLPAPLRAPEAALVGSGGCRQGDALGPLVIAYTTLHPLPKYQQDCGQQHRSSDAATLPVTLQCFMNDTIMTASNSNQLCFLRKFFQNFPHMTRP
ncbi:Hypothetical protein, putative [Bodo saltans]|uniref:Uncharacterized protein n=1 Tax=Bodo saltans TaxID=75058 RepID=A0A0S4J9M8_BODSA|nr:Hypothetical protein, putative [Bodo saltans]|eukprot:CUG86615.1 Hypothetical protein, putative [Bodo saltans]